MQQQQINVPGVAWWILALLIVPAVQAWLEQTFPGSNYRWVPLAVAVLGAIAKWIQWVLSQNNVQIDSIPDGAAADVQVPARKISIRWLLLG